MRAVLTGVLALVVAAGLSACGGSAAADEEAQIEDVVAGFQAAIEAKDPKAFCARLAPNDVAKLGRGRSDGKKRCLVIWGRDRNLLFEAADPALEIDDISFNGPYATAALANGGELAFAKEGGRWYVHLAPDDEK